MKLIGVDYGRRRIGIAITDDSGSSVRGLPTLDRLKHPDAIGSLCTIITHEQPVAIVIGLPLSILDGETEMSREVRTFAANLKKKSNLPVHFVDESLSSVRSHDILKVRKKKQRRDKGNVDRIAACLILDSYIKDPSSCVTN